MGKTRSVPELVAWQPPELPKVIGGGILHREERLVIFGKFGTWKSMIAMHTGYCIAQGTPWFGYDTEKLTVLILQTEVSEYMYRDRIIDYNITNNCNPPNLFIWTEERIKLDSNYGMAELDKRIGEVGANIVVIDPFYKVVNSTNDLESVGKFIDNLDILKAKHKCSYVVIHHNRKTQTDPSGNVIDLGGEEASGVQLLNNWTDGTAGVKVTFDNRVDVHLNLRFYKLRNVKKVSPPPIDIATSRDHLTLTKIEKPISILMDDDSKENQEERMPEDI